MKVWLKMKVEAVPAIEDSLEDWFWIQGAVSVAIPPPHQEARTLEGLFDGGDPARLTAELQAAAQTWGAKPGAIAFSDLSDSDWQTSWRDNFKPIQIGRFCLVGEWEQAEDDPFVIRIYPGQAFGTGQHETTQLVLEFLQERELKQMSLLDIGCGNGILAIAAERLGADRVFGFDYDRDCEENMGHHLRINRTRVTDLRIGVLDDFEPQPFDLITANITINVLAPLWPKLAPWLSPNGVLICSGILDIQRDEALRGLAQAGFTVSEVRGKGEWLLIAASRS